MLSTAASKGKGVAGDRWIFTPSLCAPARSSCALYVHRRIVGCLNSLPDSHAPASRPARCASRCRHRGSRRSWSARCTGPPALSQSHPAAAPESPGVLPSLWTDVAFVPGTGDAGDAGDAGAGASAGRIAAEQLLDAWCLRPRSAWRALGVRALQATRVEACARTASQVRLERVVAHRVPAMEAWLVRDFADTAWFSAPEDGAASSSAIEMAARRAVTNGALALLAREWLPGEDFRRLTMMMVMR